MSTSEQTTWNVDEPEWFYFLGSEYDVQAAKRILMQRKRVEVTTFEIEGAAPLVGAPGVISVGVRIDWDKAQSDAVNLDVPVILAYTRKGDLLPIDGWHRVAKAKLNGLATLPCVVLTKTESKRIRQD